MDNTDRLSEIELFFKNTEDEIELQFILLVLVFTLQENFELCLLFCQLELFQLFLGKISGDRNFVLVNSWEIKIDRSY